MNFSIILKDLMSRKGWNQEDLAKAGEVKQPTVSRYLSGHTIPTLTLEVTVFLRFLKNSPDALEIFWKIYKMDQSGRKSMNALAERIIEE